MEWCVTNKKVMTWEYGKKEKYKIFFLQKKII